MTVDGSGSQSVRTSPGAHGAAARFVLARLLSSISVLLVVSVAVFLFVHAAPGGPEQSIGGQFASPDQLETIREEYRLDDPLVVQYGRFLGSVVTLDLGTSFSTREPVASSLGRAAAVTVPLLLVAWLVAVLVGTLLGLVTAYRAGTRLDRGVLVGTTVLASSPVFVTGVVLAYVFGVQLGWLPTVGGGDGGLDTLRHLVLPATTLALLALASMSRIARVRIGQVLHEDQVTFARARGFSTPHVVMSSVLPNAGVQLITQAGAVLISMMGGVIVVEEVFNLNGIGTLLVDAIAARDIPVVQSVTLVLAVGIIVVNALADLACLAIDPRISQSDGSGR